MVSLHLRSNLSCTLLYLLSVLQVSVQAQATHWSYSVKIINPRNAGGQCVESWSAEEFSSVDDIKSRLCEDFSDQIMENSVKFGYIVPGHGLKESKWSLKRMMILLQCTIAIEGKDV